MSYEPIPSDSPLLEAGYEWTREDLVRLINWIAALHGLLETGNEGTGFATNEVVIGSEDGGLTGLALNHGDLIVGQGTISDRKAPIALPVGNAGQILELAIKAQALPPMK